MQTGIMYRPLLSTECVRIKEVDATQFVRRAWRDVDGSKQLVEINWQDDDFPNGYENHLAALNKTFEQGGFVVGAFYDEILVGFCSVNRTVFGNRFKYVLLDQIFISSKYRNIGIGKNLFMRASAAAWAWGADKLYICAGSAEETIAFYFSLGCTEAQEINQVLYENDTNDIQLEYSLA